MRVLWAVSIFLLVVGLVAWGTTCTGPRPRPTGDTIPPGEVATTTVSPAGSPVAPAGTPVAP